MATVHPIIYRVNVAHKLEYDLDQEGFLSRLSILADDQHSPTAIIPQMAPALHTLFSRPTTLSTVTIYVRTGMYLMAHREGNGALLQIIITHLHSFWHHML